MIENSAQDIGSILKSQREKLGYSLQDAAQHTRIRLASLESIENNQFSDLPGQVYVTGFIKVYASYLGVDSAPLLKQLEDIQSTQGAPSVKSISVVKHQTQRFGKSSPGIGWGTIVLGLFVILIIVAIMYFLSPVFQNQDLDEKTSIQVIPEQEPVPGVEANGEAGRKVTEASIAEQDVAESRPDAEPDPANIEAESQEHGILPLISQSGSSLRMLALSEGSLIINLDDREPQHYDLHDGLDLTWNVKEIVKVKLASPGLARFWLDDQELDLGDLESFQLQPVSGD
ncbi:MAG: helix-turn-helix domain-containing protein [Desulfuromonadales bacterium]|nr:helix-turn-helix domain-containing protein [Desulfuromonadales bacterium]